MAATTFPFTLGSMSNLKNTSGHIPRVNMKNDGQYNIAGGISLSGSYVVVQGYSSTPGDGGRATIDASTNTVAMFTCASSNQVVADIIVQNNGTSGTSRGFVTGSSPTTFVRCVANNIRGNGFHLNQASSLVIECEAYACNKANTTGDAGFFFANQTTFINCIAHDNSGNGCDGFGATTAATADNKFFNCISESNGRHGFSLLPAGGHIMVNCDAYNNGGDGLKNGQTTQDSQSVLRNINFIKNTGWAVNGAFTTGRWTGTMENCGFGSGSQANGSGDTNGTNAVIISGSVTYASGVTPWVDPANGDFRVNLRAAVGTGRGAFTQTQSSYGNASMVAWTDIGAVQHRDFQRSSVSGD